MLRSIQKSKHTIKNVIYYLNRPWREFVFKLDDCCNNFACSFGNKGWHHLVETYKQIEKDPSLQVEKTVLYIYHNKFQPYGICDCLPPNSVKFTPPWGLYPWGSFKYGPTTFATNQDRTRCCGPSSLSVITDEFNRMKILYDGLKKEGYRPWSFGNNYISGIILETNENRRKMLVIHGNHRLAALAALGCKFLPIRLFKGRIRHLKEKNVKKWHYVKTGQCSIEDAIKIFRLYFTENGNHIKQILGL